MSMPELFAKMVADTPILAVLIVVLWKGSEKLDRFGEKFDKLTLAVRGLSGKVDMIGKLTDARLELHEERTTGKHQIVTTATLRGPGGNASPASTRVQSHPSWPDQPADGEDD